MLLTDQTSSRISLVHVHDPRVRWSISASRVLRIISEQDWHTGPTIDVLAGLGPPPGLGVAAHRVVVVRGPDDHEHGLAATGAIDIAEVDRGDVLALPPLLVTHSPQVLAIVVAHDASLSLLFEPSAVIRPDDNVRGGEEP